ncbi:hypothetical protein ACL9RL_17890 [Plantibacter sp. Mn2098]|uniref:hypothetical protein n=1 Tax=Plantibacter sp. Mn2098 TaxID=3395266 RepID=UPI003BE2CB78
MSIISTPMIALAVAAAALAPVGASVVSASPAVSGSVQTEAHTASSAVSITSVDWFRSRDKVVTGHATPGAATVRISGLALRPGAYREGVVAADGSFTVDLAPFASRAIPLSTLTATAVGADGSIGGTANFVVQLSAKPAAAASSVKPAGLIGSTVSQHVSQHVTTGVEVDAIAAGSGVITGSVPAGTQDVAVDVFGSTIFGEVEEDGAFSIDLGEYAAYSVVGVTFEVWAAAADGSILPSVSVPVTAPVVA